MSKIVREFTVTGEPENNREIIEFTKRRFEFPKASMDKNKDGKSQLYLNDHGFLEPFDFVTFFETGLVTVAPFIPKP